MGILIKSRWGDRVIYAAETATDVRAAVEEAARTRANLAGAYLAGAYLAGAYLTGANLEGACLEGAYLAGANLVGANLAGANLAACANLARANLAGADLEGANLAGANLAGANLAGANGLRRMAVGPRDADGWITAYKAVNDDRSGAGNRSELPRLVYTDGATVEVPNADTSEALCAAGVNVATWDWVMRNYPGAMYLTVKFRPEDIASVPYASDGKFRLHRCVVVGEVGP